jgi:hypothetical protein
LVHCRAKRIGSAAKPGASEDGLEPGWTGGSCVNPEKPALHLRQALAGIETERVNHRLNPSDFNYITNR